MFLVNSRYPLVCAPRFWLPRNGASFSRSYGGNLPSSLTIVLSTPRYTLPSHLCWFRVRSICQSYFLEHLHSPEQSDKPGQFTVFVTSGRPRNINLVSIDYAFRPRLRSRLTLRGLTLRRNPWDFGESVSHTLCRYSCQHSHFRYLQRPSRVRLHRLTERSATT